MIPFENGCVSVERPAPIEGTQHLSDVELTQRLHDYTLSYIGFRELMRYESDLSEQYIIDDVTLQRDLINPDYLIDVAAQVRLNIDTYLYDWVKTVAVDLGQEPPDYRSGCAVVHGNTMGCYRMFLREWHAPPSREEAKSGFLGKMQNTQFRCSKAVPRDEVLLFPSPKTCISIGFYTELLDTGLRFQTRLQIHPSDLSVERYHLDLLYLHPHRWLKLENPASV